jgi:hypothetical protein
MGGTGGALVFLTIVGGFFGFMFVVAFLTTSARTPPRVRDYGWPIETEMPAPVLDLLLRLVWGVVIVAALMTLPLAALAFIVALIPLIFGSHLGLPEVLRNFITAEVVYGIVIAASLVVGVALFMSLLVAELISERKNRHLAESQLVAVREPRPPRRRRR